MLFMSTGAYAAPIVIDDGDTEYSSGGGWTTYTSGGEFDGDQQYVNDGGTAAAVYAYVLPNGPYTVYAQWRQQNNRSTDVEYTITGYGGVDVVVDGINQRNAPASDLLIDDANGAGTLTFPFQSLATVSVTTGSLTVEVRDNDGTGKDTYAIADATTVQLIPEPATLCLAAVGLLGLRRRRRACHRSCR